MTDQDVPTSRDEKYIHWVYNTFDAYGVDHEEFAQPADCLVDDLLKGKVLLKKVEYQGKKRLMTLYYKDWIYPTFYDADEQSLHAFGERYRMTDSGEREVRFPSGDIVSGTVERNEPSLDAALRELSEEGRFPNPELGLLLPRGRYYDGAERWGLLASRIQHCPLRVLKESFPYKGLLSGSIVSEYDYIAGPEDYRKGEQQITKERSITTFCGWKKIA